MQICDVAHHEIRDVDDDAPGEIADPSRSDKKLKRFRRLKMRRRTTMATNPLQRVVRPAIRNYKSRCSGAVLPSSCRTFTCAPRRAEQLEVESELASEPKRWATTPHRMIARISHNIKDNGAGFVVNEDPHVLDTFYARFLGPEHVQMLSEETRWLAITHKSFDQGRRGFNDRLALYGMSQHSS